MSEITNAAVAIVHCQENVVAIMASVEIIAAETRIIAAQTFVFHPVVLDQWTPSLGREKAFEYTSDRKSSRLWIVKKENLVAHLLNLMHQCRLRCVNSFPD